jgi:glycosyltransferase involved in cell wall biosynthesis
MDVSIKDENKYLLSIIFPLHNSARRLKPTLDSFLIYFREYLGIIDFCFVDNCSNDETLDMLLQYQKKESEFRIISEETYLDIGSSILRASKHAYGEYTLLWGDDDIPLPGFLSILVSLLSAEKPVVLYFNRFRVSLDEDARKGRLIESLDSDRIIHYNNMESFIEDYFPNITFISSIVFRSKNQTLWPEDVNNTEILGYSFMTNIFPPKLERGEQLVFYRDPLCIQNKPKQRSWNKYVPLYRIVGLSRLLAEWQKRGFIKNVSLREIYRGKKLLMFYDFIIIIKHIYFYIDYVREMTSLLFEKSSQDG